MKNNATALCCGILFGTGLCLSQLINPVKVIGFLDLAGAWDPSLGLVMGGALLVTIPATRWILKKPAPLFGKQFFLPTKRDLDPRLLGGAALFGIGWGLAGICPGPAVTGLASGMPAFVWFTLAMLAGILLHFFLLERQK